MAVCSETLFFGAPQAKEKIAYAKGPKSAIFFDFQVIFNAVKPLRSADDRRARTYFWRSVGTLYARLLPPAGPAAAG